VQRRWERAPSSSIRKEDIMTNVNRTGIVFCVALALCAVSSIGHAQQWQGSQNEKGTIWRPGNVAIGAEPQRQSDEKALFDLRGESGGNSSLESVLLRVSYTIPQGTTRPFEVDGRRAYAGAARSKAGVLPADFDFAVHRSAAIGTVNFADAIPGGYKLVVGGKILAEEIRVKLIKDWADYVFAPSYRLKSLGEVEDHIRTHRRLPDIPSATEVGESGVDIGDMQAKLLAKIEELTLYVIEQKKAIDALHRKVMQLEEENAPLEPRTLR
jgi:hypothetical protein